MRPHQHAIAAIGASRWWAPALVLRNSFAPRRADVRLEVLPVLEGVVRTYATPVRARGVAAAAVRGARAWVALVMHVVLEVLSLVERALRFAAAAPRAVLYAAAPEVRAKAKVVALLAMITILESAVDGRRRRRIRRRGDHRVVVRLLHVHFPFLLLRLHTCLRARDRARKQTPKKERRSRAVRASSVGPRVGSALLASDGYSYLFF